MEPTGASFGRDPLAREEVQDLAKAARAAGCVLIFDETITGFRVSPGGAQQLFAIAPDLIVLGKVLGGGLPCGALAGRKDLLQALDNRNSRSPDGAYVCHMGTGNGNPVVAATGYETLRALADGTAIAKADVSTERLRTGLNKIFSEASIPWAAYGQSSGFHIFMNPAGRSIDPLRFDAKETPAGELAERNGRLINNLRVALLGEGIDINPWPGGLVSAAHDSETIDEALIGFSKAFETLMKSEKRFAGWSGEP